jgi:hypothetical protein
VRRTEMKKEINKTEKKEIARMNERKKDGVKERQRKK